MKLDPTTTSITLPSANINVISGSSIGLSEATISLNSDTKQFFELILLILGYDITYDSFVSLTPLERAELIRDIKLKNLLNESK